MSKKKTVLIALGLLAAAGAVAAVSAQGFRGHHGRHMGPGMGPGMDLGEGMGGGWRGRGPLTKDVFDTRTRERFAAIDKNSDGVLDVAEIEAYMTLNMGQRHQRMGHRVGMTPGTMGERMLRRLGADKEGRLTKDAYLAHIKKLFAEMDLNNDSRISDDDLPPMMRGRNVLAGGAAGPGQMRPGQAGPGRMGQGPGGGLFGVLRGADADKDGVVTLAEALAAAEKRFATLDKTKDGVVDKADFEAMRKEMLDYRVKRFVHHFGGDKDNRVTREQFLAKAGERFARLDLNGDGTVARDEMPGRGWRGRHGGPHGSFGGDHPGSGPGQGPGQGPGPRRGSGN